MLVSASRHQEVEVRPPLSDRNALALGAAWRQANQGAVIMLTRSRPLEVQRLGSEGSCARASPAMMVTQAAVKCKLQHAPTDGHIFAMHSTHYQSAPMGSSLAVLDTKLIVHQTVCNFAFLQFPQPPDGPC